MQALFDSSSGKDIQTKKFVDLRSEGGQTSSRASSIHSHPLS